MADTTTYVMVWSGGYERPSYATTKDLEAAQMQAAEWAADANGEAGDDIDILTIAPNGVLLDVEDYL